MSSSCNCQCSCKSKSVEVPVEVPVDVEMTDSVPVPVVSEDKVKKQRKKKEKEVVTVSEEVKVPKKRGRKPILSRTPEELIRMDESKRASQRKNYMAKRETRIATVKRYYSNNKDAILEGKYGLNLHKIQAFLGYLKSGAIEPDFV